MDNELKQVARHYLYRINDLANSFKLNHGYRPKFVRVGEASEFYPAVRAYMDELAKCSPGSPREILGLRIIITNAISDVEVTDGL